jgi:hypothetical protein
MKLHLSKYSALSAGFASLALVSAPTTIDGGLHFSTSTVNPFVTIQAIATDAIGFEVAGLTKIKVPTRATITGEPCLASDEYSQLNCEETRYGSYVDAYRLTVSYFSKDTNLASDEYSRGGRWTADFVFDAKDVNADLAAAALSAHGKQKREALQKLVASYNSTTLDRQATVITRECPRELVGDTERRKIDTSCEDETAVVTEKVVALQVQLSK